MFAVPTQVGQDDKYQHQEVGKPLSLCVELASEKFGVDPTAGAVFVHCGQDTFVGSRGWVVHRTPFATVGRWLAHPWAWERERVILWGTPFLEGL